MTDVIHMYSPQPRKYNPALSFRWSVKCEQCYGAGWYAEQVPGTENDWIPDYNERYCDCEAGKWRRAYDGGEPTDIYEQGEP